MNPAVPEMSSLTMASAYQAALSTVKVWLAKNPRPDRELSHPIDVVSDRHPCYERQIVAIFDDVARSGD